MNVMLDISHLHGSRGGGIHFYLENLLAALSGRTNNRNFDLRYFNLYSRPRIAPSAHPVLQSARCVNIRFPVKFLNLLWLYLSFPDLSRWLPDIDIFHGTHFSLPVMSQAKLLLTVHDLMYLTNPEYYDPRWKSTNDYGYRTLLPRNIKRADHIVAISEFTKRQLMALFPETENKITVVHHAIATPPKLTDARIDQVLARFKLTQGSYIYFPAGTYERRKNIQRTIEAFKKASQAASMTLVISCIGDVPRDQASAPGVQLVQWQTDDDKHALFQGARFVMYPSLCEGFGVPVLEAMSYGKAVLTSDNSALAEVGRGVALLVDPTDTAAISTSIDRLVVDCNLRKHLESSSLTKVRQFSRDTIGNEYLSLYRAIAEAPVSIAI